MSGFFFQDIYLQYMPLVVDCMIRNPIFIYTLMGHPAPSIGVHLIELIEMFGSLLHITYRTQFLFTSLMMYDVAHNNDQF